MGCGNLSLDAFGVGTLRLSSLADQAKLALPAHNQRVSVDAMRLADDTWHRSIIHKLSERVNRFLRGWVIMSSIMAGVTQYTAQIGEFICLRIANGESLRQIVTDPDMPASSTVFKWLSEQKSFSEQYARAREAQMEVMAQEIIDIADDGRNDTYTDEDGNEHTNQDVINRSRLRVDTRKWLMSKLAPKKYGDKITHQGDSENPVVHEVRGMKAVRDALYGTAEKE